MKEQLQADAHSSFSKPRKSGAYRKAGAAALCAASALGDDGFFAAATSSRGSRRAVLLDPPTVRSLSRFRPYTPVQAFGYSS